MSHPSAAKTSSRARSHPRRGFDQELVLGNTSAQRHWGYARDYVEAMWLMRQHTEPDEYVVATDETHSARDFSMRFSQSSIWRRRNARKKNASLKRPTEPVELVGWKPRADFQDLVREMVEAELAALERTDDDRWLAL